MSCRMHCKIELPLPAPQSLCTALKQPRHYGLPLPPIFPGCVYIVHRPTFTIPTPIGEGGGDKTNLSNSTFFCLETLG